MTSPIGHCFDVIILAEAMCTLSFPRQYRGHHFQLLFEICQAKVYEPLLWTQNITISVIFVVGLQVVPEDWWNGKRPPIPLWNKKVDIFIGEPMQFDIQTLSQVAFKWARAPAGVGYTSGLGSTGYNPHPLPYGVRRCSSLLQVAETLDRMRIDGVDIPGPLLDEAAWRWMYTHITEHIWVALSDVTEKARTLNRLRAGS